MKDAWRVFAQGAARRDADWIRHAKQFFDTEIAFEGARVAIVAGAKRAIAMRARDERDLRDALAAPNAADNGLYDLAERRCESVWLVEREGPSDRAALLLAAIVASVCLGPILGDAPRELFGVRTAREKLVSLA